MAVYSTTNAPLPWMEPYMQDYMSRAQGVANQPYQASPTQFTAPNAYLDAGWQAMANRAQMGSPVMGAANTQLQNTINGGFLGQNPYLSDAISNAQGDLTRAWNTVQRPSWETQMQRSGSFGNTGVAEMAGSAQNDLQRNLARIGSDMRLGAYNQERGLQQQAIGMAPQFANQDYVDANAMLTAGQQRQTYDQGVSDQNYRWWQEAQAYPQPRLGLLGNALGIGGNSGTTTQTQPDPSTLSQVIGGGLTGLALWKALTGG
jgi:hypothetical protein